MEIAISVEHRKPVRPVQAFFSPAFSNQPKVNSKEQKPKKKKERTKNQNITYTNQKETSKRKIKL
jgi:hypothetical protein